MRSLFYIAFFGLIVVVSSGISFVGYHYLSLANDYREANFKHLDLVDRSANIVQQNQVLKQGDIESLSNNLTIAVAEAEWCLENLGTVDRALFNVLGVGDAIQVCEDGIASAKTAREHLDALQVAQSQSITASLLVHKELLLELERLRALSLAFQPYLNSVQDDLERFIHIGTSVVSVLLILLSALVARQIIAAQQRVQRQSVTDPLTGLLNRRGLDDLVLKLSDEDETILARIDLDRFKRVNDVLGHDAGDFVLTHVANIMRRYTRSEDVLARVGGDEFVILFAPETSLENAQLVVLRMLASVTKPVQYKDKLCVYGASFGLASTSVAGPSMSSLLSAADKALYQVKRSGRGAVAIYSEEMHTEAEQERALAERFPDALRNGEIVPYFQSQHLANDWSLSGVEILARWEHPELGTLGPDQFLSIASQLGMEADLDRFMFQRTLELVDDLDSKDLRLPRVSFNVSLGRITDPTFLEEIANLIPTDRSRYAFEILESVSYEESSDVLAVAISGIRELGFKIDVDDFGSGHASINSVMNIQPDALKIDRQIVKPIEENEQSMRMVESIIELANALDLGVIAEGVDSEEKALLLRERGCHALQGYYFSKPMPVHALEAFLRDSRGIKEAG